MLCAFANIDACKLRSDKSASIISWPLPSNLVSNCESGAPGISTANTLAPACEKAIATSLPIPPAAPVTTTLLPLRPLSLRQFIRAKLLPFRYLVTPQLSVIQRRDGRFQVPSDEEPLLHSSHHTIDLDLRQSQRGKVLPIRKRGPSTTLPSDATN